MQSFTTLTLLLSLALSSVVASPIEKRATISCESTPRTTRHLASYGEEDVYYSLGNTTTTDHLGQKSKVLISQKDDGTPFSLVNSTNFDFYACNSTYMNYTITPDGSYTQSLYGLLKPKGQTKNCLQTKTGSVDTADQVFTSSLCSDAEDSTQQQQTWLYYPNDGESDFISTRFGPNQKQHPTYFSRSDVGHRALKLNAGNAKDTQNINLVPA